MRQVDQLTKEGFIMKQGKTLTELAAEIERQAAAKLDLVAEAA